jgi:hypothetical protein
MYPLISSRTSFISAGLVTIYSNVETVPDGSITCTIS